jgi:hypothetical protein
VKNEGGANISKPLHSPFWKKLGGIVLLVLVLVLVNSQVWPRMGVKQTKRKQARKDLIKIG